MTKNGIFTISIDVELAWGICDKQIQPTVLEAIKREREIIQRLLALFRTYNVRATWAIVGHLLLTEAAWDDDKAHPEFPRPVLHDETQDWFFQLPPDPNDLAWYGRDLIEWIRNSEPAQEIGSHSFCHLPFDENRTYRAAIETDIAMAQKLHDAEELPFESFIFPRNCVGYRDVLAQAGIRVYRGRTPRWYSDLPPPLQRTFNLLTFLLAVSPPLVKATIDELGLVNIPASILLLGRDGLRKFIPFRNMRRITMAGLDQAAKNGEIFHLWFHPSNFSHQMDKQFALMEKILIYASRLRNDGNLKILSMSEIAQQF